MPLSSPRDSPNRIAERPWQWRGKARPRTKQRSSTRKGKEEDRRTEGEIKGGAHGDAGQYSQLWELLAVINYLCHCWPGARFPQQDLRIHESSDLVLSWLCSQH